MGGLHSRSAGLLQGWQAEFSWLGTTDTSAWLAVPTALRIWHALGMERVRQHNHKKLRHAVQNMNAAWGSDLAVIGTTLTFAYHQ